ncbi:MAG: hypothetical protein RBR39_12350 [Proteiniphilum sp.]|nr:hypothetical protein [Proteiniphilum sp.]
MQVEAVGLFPHVPTVGRCNHEIHCGYHYPPRQYFLCDYFPRERIEEAMELYALAGYILEELA